MVTTASHLSLVCGSKLSSRPVRTRSARQAASLPAFLLGGDYVMNGACAVRSGWCDARTSDVCS
jgi:hypothetical protein